MIDEHTLFELRRALERIAAALERHHELWVRPCECGSMTARLPCHRSHQQRLVIDNEALRGQTEGQR